MFDVLFHSVKNGNLYFTSDIHVTDLFATHSIILFVLTSAMRNEPAILITGASELAVVVEKASVKLNISNMKIQLESIGYAKILINKVCI